MSEIINSNNVCVYVWWCMCICVMGRRYIIQCSNVWICEWKKKLRMRKNISSSRETRIGWSDHDHLLASSSSSSSSSSCISSSCLSLIFSLYSVIVLYWIKLNQTCSSSILLGQHWSDPSLPLSAHIVSNTYSQSYTHTHTHTRTICFILHDHFLP